MRDLSRYIVRQQAAQWKWLGQELLLKDDKIAGILVNNKNDAESCCREMLITWLDSDIMASWGKLDDAIKRMTVLPSTTSSVSPNKKGNHN